MTRPYERALRAVERELGPGAAGSVLRTEVDDEGGLVLTLDAHGLLRWFAFRGDELHELRVADETRIPAAPDLARACDAGLAEVLSWRPGRRLVARVLEKDGSHVVVKAWRRGRAAAAVRRHVQFAAAVGSDLRVARILRADTEQDLVVYERVSGSEPRFDDGTVFPRIGAALAVIQRTRPPAELAQHGRAQELAQLDRHARRFASVAGEPPRAWCEARARLDALTESSPAEPVLAHRDLHEGQFLVDDARLTLLDFDLACRAERELDLGNLIAHARLAGWLGSRGADESRAQGAERAVLEACDGADERRLGFYIATSALRLVLVHGLRPRAAAAIPPLLALARGSVAEACRA